MLLPSIILIGPVRAGKTTLADQVAKELGWPRASLDERRWDYYREIGFDPDYSRSLEQAGRWNDRRRYWSEHDPHAISRFLEEYGQGHVLDFGGSHSLHEDEAQLEAVRRLLAPYHYVVLVLPCADP